MKVLVVEDDIILGAALKDSLEERGLDVEIATTGEDAVQLLDSFEYDMILLDWNLPGMSGLAVCQRFRKANGNSYIIFLTSENDIQRKEEALDAGGDDYLVKPFEIRELLARMRSLTRRSLTVTTSVIEINGIVLDPTDRRVSCAGKIVNLTNKEAQLLEFLMRHPNRPYTGARLFNAIWKSDSDASSDTVKVWMNNLRSKLAKVGKKDLIKTVVGSGYVIETD